MKWKSLDRKHRDRVSGLSKLAAHEILEIPQGATEADIKVAFRNKARAYHPDRVDPFLRAQAEEIMKLLNEAYRVMLAGLHK